MLHFDVTILDWDRLMWCAMKRCFFVQYILNHLDAWEIQNEYA